MFLKEISVCVIHPSNKVSAISLPRHSVSCLQQEKSHLVPVQGEGSVPLTLANPSPAGLLTTSSGLQSEEYDASSVLPSLSSPPLCSSSSSSQP